MTEEFKESPALQARMLAHAIGADQRILDFVARLACAWNGRGDVVLNEAERRALCSLAGLLPIEDDPYMPERAINMRRQWSELRPDHRRRLVVAARRAIEFARVCAWVFGEGQGPQI